MSMKTAILATALVLTATSAAQAQWTSPLTFEPDYNGGVVFSIGAASYNPDQCKNYAALLNKNLPQGMWIECAVRDDLEGRWVPVPGPSWLGEAAAKAASRDVQLPEPRIAQ